MSIGSQFKRQGERGVALALWGLIIYMIFKHPFKTIGLIIIGFLVLGWLINDSDYSSDKNYVKVEVLNVRSYPDGDIVGKVHMNDTLQMVGKEGPWYKVLFNNDTCFVKEGYFSKREITKWDALRMVDDNMYNKEVGYDPKTTHIKLKAKYKIINNKTFKSGHYFKLNYLPSKFDSTVNVTPLGNYYGSQYSTYIHISELEIDWDKVKMKYPHVNYD